MAVKLQAIIATAYFDREKKRQSSYKCDCVHTPQNIQSPFAFQEIAV